MHVWGFLGGGHCFDGHEDILRNAGAHDIAADFNHLTEKLEPFGMTQN